MPSLGLSYVARGFLKRANGLKLILAAHFVLGVIYSVTFPMWEAPDEWGHFDYVRFVADHFRLPGPGDKASVPNNERSQPPLYYIITGTLTSWAKTQPDWFPPRNPLAGVDTTRGFNFVVHTDDESFPYRDTALAFHAARLVSVFLSLFGVLATYAVVRMWLPADKRVALLSAAIHAFWPKYLFAGSVITNDIMAAVSGSLFMWAWAAWILRRPSWKSGLAVLATIAMMALAKLSVYGLVVLGGFGLVFTAANRLLRRPRVNLGLVVMALAAVFSLLVFWIIGMPGWLPHLPFGSRLLDYFGYLSSERITNLGWSTIPPLLSWALYTFWGGFAIGNLLAPSASYWAITIVAFISLGGLVRWLARSPRCRGGVGWLLVGILGSVTATVIATLVQKSGVRADGRFYLSALTPLSILLALGWHHLWPGRVTAKAALVLGLSLFAFSALIPFALFIPAYARPALLPPEAEAKISHPLDRRYGLGIRLAGYDVSPAKVKPGETMHLTLYWQSLLPVNENYIVAAKLLTSDMGVLSETYRYPGRGNFATTLWKPGDFFKETYDLAVPTSAAAPFRGQFFVELLNARWAPAFTPRDVNGNAADSWFGEFKVTGSAAGPAPEVSTNYRLNSQIVLTGYALHVTPGTGIGVDLRWEVLQPVPADYTVALVLIGPEQQVISQADAQPRNGTYPTHLWDSGESVMDPHVLPLPADMPCGNYTIYLGLYDLNSSFRLPVIGPDGQDIPDRSIKIPVALTEDCPAR